MKHVSVVALLAVFILVPALVAMDAGQRDVFRVGEATWVSDNEIAVPISVSHDEDLVAMDIPLEYSEGVTLTGVNFNDTRVGYFDAKMSSIDAATRQVTIGLITMVYERKPALAPSLSADNGLIANLTFRVDNPSLTEFEIKPFSSQNPSHDLNLIYNDYSSGAPVVQSIAPEFEGGTVSLKPNPAVVIPTVYALSQNYPNPFNPTTVVAYDLPKAGDVNLEIYNILGQKVKTLVNGHQEAGHYSITWDGQNDAQEPVASGVYFYRVSAGDFKDIKKMVMMK